MRELLRRAQGSFFFKHLQHATCKECEIQDSNRIIELVCEVQEYEKEVTEILVSNKVVVKSRSNSSMV